MSVVIRKMLEKDRAEVLGMMEVFYNSPAVYTSGSAEIFEKDFDACIGDCPYLEGYVFEEELNILGYAMLAKSFSTEFGKECIWIEDIYLKECSRGKGAGKMFFKYIDEKYPMCIKRLEVEKENEGAVHLYKKTGFTELPYMEMKK